MRVSLPEAEIGIYAVSERHGQKPLVLQYSFDVGSLRDPIGHKEFVGLDGREKEVQEWIRADKRIDGIIAQCKMLAFDHIKLSQSRWLSLCFKDIHGKWIAAALAEIIADELASDYKVCTVHSWNMKSD